MHRSKTGCADAFHAGPRRFRCVLSVNRRGSARRFSVCVGLPVRSNRAGTAVDPVDHKAGERPCPLPFRSVRVRKRGPWLTKKAPLHRERENVFLQKRAEKRAATQGRKRSRIKAVCRRGAATAESRRPATPVGIENVLHFRFCVKNCRPRAKRTGVFQAFSVIQTRHNGIGRLR